MARKRERNRRYVTAYCEACGEPFRIRAERASQRHCSNLCAARRGPANNRYNGGLCYSGGRLIICCRDGTSLHYYRAVMEAELRRPLRPDEIVHHINGQSDDDRPENLEVLSRAEHLERHPEVRAAGRVATSAKRGELHHNAALTNEQAAAIRARHARGDISDRAIAALFGTTPTVVLGIVKGRTYV